MGACLLPDNCHAFAIILRSSLGDNPLCSLFALYSQEGPEYEWRPSWNDKYLLYAPCLVTTTTDQTARSGSNIIWYDIVKKLVNSFSNWDAYGHEHDKARVCTTTTEWKWRIVWLGCINYMDHPDNNVTAISKYAPSAKKNLLVVRPVWSWLAPIIALSLG